MKKTLIQLVMILALSSGITNTPKSIAQGQPAFVWGYQTEFQPCSSWLAIYQIKCVPSPGGFCQVSAQNPCPDPEYYAVQ
ncbi:hypothetical protein [Algoriphagus taiwanensis]|uniref:hypothetical protein n=1 Tax=Algoriphagus taiwanensis TaxID=1445656 RepID=UPI0030C77B9A